MKACESANDARDNIKDHIEFYNAERKHQTLGKTPDQAYFKPVMLPKAA